MRGFIKLALAGIISFSSSAFSNSNELNVDGQGIFKITNMVISEGVAKVKFDMSGDFNGFGDPALDCDDSEFIVISDQEHLENNYHGIEKVTNISTMKDKIWTILFFSFAEETTIRAKIKSINDHKCMIVGVRFNK